jgi:hypothetical protein
MTFPISSSLYICNDFYYIDLGTLKAAQRYYHRHIFSAILSCGSILALFILEIVFNFFYISQLCSAWWISSGLCGAALVGGPSAFLVSGRCQVAQWRKNGQVREHSMHVVKSIGRFKAVRSAFTILRFIYIFVQFDKDMALLCRLVCSSSQYSATMHKHRYICTYKYRI